jgi:protein-S-isoprenylcysteine O-methyltransferase Ste14
MLSEGEILFRILLLAILLLFIGHRAYYNAKISGDENEILDQKADGWVERIAGLLIMLALIGSVLYIVKPAWVAWAAIRTPRDVRWLGVALATAGFILLQWSQNALGEQWSDRPQIVADHILVQGGPYQWIRHPIYTSFLLILSAPLFVSSNWFIGLAWILGTALDIAKRIAFEEEKLGGQFGEDYRKYRERTGALLPRL